jgi:hypothetical protein
MSPENNALSPLEAKLRHLFGEQRRLRELLERTRSELDAVNREVLKTQEEYCTDTTREEEYDQGLERILGSNTRLNLKDLEEASANEEKFEDLIRALEAASRT